MSRLNCYTVMKVHLWLENMLLKKACLNVFIAFFVFLLPYCKLRKNCDGFVFEKFCFVD